MARTIDEAFRELRTNLEITGLQQSNISTRQQRIRAILERAVEWGELPVSADIDTACQALVSMAAYRGLIEHKSFDPQFFQQLIDRVLLPILQAGGQPEILGDPHHG